MKTKEELKSENKSKYFIEGYVEGSCDVQYESGTEWDYLKLFTMLFDNEWKNAEESQGFDFAMKSIRESQKFKDFLEGIAQGDIDGAIERKNAFNKDFEIKRAELKLLAGEENATPWDILEAMPDVSVLPFRVK